MMTQKNVIAAQSVTTQHGQAACGASTAVRRVRADAIAHLFAAPYMESDTVMSYLHKGKKCQQSLSCAEPCRFCWSNRFRIPIEWFQWLYQGLRSCRQRFPALASTYCSARGVGRFLTLKQIWQWSRPRRPRGRTSVQLPDQRRFPPTTHTCSRHNSVVSVCWHSATAIMRQPGASMHASSSQHVVSRQHMHSTLEPGGARSRVHSPFGVQVDLKGLHGHACTLRAEACHTRQ